MKLRHVISVSLLLMALAACNSPQREARRMVKRAECLADTLPDSTARLIDSVLRMPVSFSERERMDMALLQAEALMGDHGQEVPPMMDDDFFDDHAFLTTSPELERAAAYYARKKQYDKAAHAALYSGFVQQHYDEKEAAMQSLKDAEQYGKLANDSLSMAQAQYRMGGMLYDEGRYKEALDLFKAANKGFDDRYVDFAKALNSMACCYMLTGEYDSAMLCLDQGLAYADTDHSPKTRRKILNNYAVWYRKQGDYDQAIAYPTQIAHEGNLTDKDRILLNLNLGEAFAEKGETDSAAIYYGRLEQLLHDAKVEAETKVSAYNALSRFAKSQGNDSLALSYREKFEIALYEVMEQRKEQNIFRIQQQYDYESLQNEMTKKINHKQHVITIGIILFLCVVSVFLFLAVQRNKREAEAKANLFHFMQQNKELTQKNEEQEKRQIYLTQKFQENEQAFYDLLEEKNRQTQLAAEYGEALSQTLKKEQAVKLRMHLFMENKGDDEMLNLLESSVFGRQEHWEAMMETVDRLYPQLRDIVRREELGLDELEQKDVILSYVGISRKDEALLLQKSTDMVDKIRNRSRKKIKSASEDINLPKIL